MKNPLRTSLYVSMFPLKTSDNTPDSNSVQTPYLRAVLSGNTTIKSPANVVSMIDSDRAAASRYIKESSKQKRN